MRTDWGVIFSSCCCSACIIIPFLCLVIYAVIQNNKFDPTAQKRINEYNRYIKDLEQKARSGDPIAFEQWKRATQPQQETQETSWFFIWW